MFACFVLYIFAVKTFALFYAGVMVDSTNQVLEWISAEFDSDVEAQGKDG